MQISLKGHNGGTLKMEMPYQGALYIQPKNGDHTCYRCSSSLQVRVPKPQVQHDRYVGDGVCTTCDANQGVVTVKVNTIFGIEEDARVLNGRCKVY